MGGKGGEGSDVMRQQYETAPQPGTGGFIYKETGTTQPPATAKKEPPKKKETPVTESGGPFGPGWEGPLDKEPQPYAPPGFGNYPSTGTNLSPLGDALVQGMQAQPGKAGPSMPLYTGQV